MRSVKVFSAILGLGSLLPSHAGAQPNGYTLSIVAKTGDTIGGKTLTTLCCPSINNAGKVAFRASFTSGGSGAFTPSGVVAASGDAIAGMTLGALFGAVAVNDAGAIAFFASFPGGSGIFNRQPGHDRLVVATGDVISGDTITGFFEHLRLNNSGTVAFSALSSVPVFGFGVYTQHRRVAAIGDTIDGFTLTGLEFTPSLNDRGTVVVAANCACPPGFAGIFTQTRKVAMAGDTFGGVTLTGIGPGPSVNDSGEVALLAGFSGGSGLVSTRAGLLAPIGGVIGGVTLTSIFKPWLNNAGLVAFDGNPFSLTHGVFTQYARVASIGDTVDGKTIAGAPTGFFFPVLNNTGQLVFAAIFTDGSQGIVLATGSH